MYKAFREKETLLADKAYGITCNDLPDETPFNIGQQEKYRLKMQKYRNKGYRKAPDIQPGSLILVQSGTYGKHFKTAGPFRVLDVTYMNGIPKVMNYEDEDGKKRVASLSNVLLYHPRSNDESK